MRYLLLFLLLASCAGSNKVLRSAQDDKKNAPLHHAKSAPERSESDNPDSLHQKNAPLHLGSSEPEPEPARRLFGLLPPKKAVAAGVVQYGKKSTIQNTYIVGDNNRVAASGQDAPATAGDGNTVAEKNKPVEKVKTRTITKTITKTAGIPWRVWALVFGLGGAAGWWVRGKASMLNWWPSAARPG